MRAMRTNVGVQKDAKHIAQITGAAMHTSVWEKIETYGLEKIFGGEGAPNHEVYLVQLEDPRWRLFKQRVKNKQIRCQHCGAGHHLDVHHPFYKNGAALWEYKIDEVMLLCRPCHDEQHRLDAHRARMKKKTPNESPEPTTPSVVAHLER